MKLSGFGYKNAWFAVRTADAAGVASALGLEVIGPYEWPDGIGAAYAENGRLFLTPCVDGWTFCIGTGLFPLVDRNEFGERTRQLSAGLQAEAQFYATHRVVEAHAWALATPERLVRAYAYCGSDGRTSADVGTPTPQELALDFRFFDDRSPEAGDDAYWAREDLRFPGEEDVMRLAGLWSVDPTSLEEREASDTAGLLARYPAASTPARPRRAGPWWKSWRRPGISS